MRVIYHKGVQKASDQQELQHFNIKVLIQHKTGILNMEVTYHQTQEFQKSGRINHMILLNIAYIYIYI